MRRTFSMIIFAFREGYKLGYAAAIADLKYSAEAKHLLFRIQASDKYKPRRKP